MTLPHLPLRARWGLLGSLTAYELLAGCPPELPGLGPGYLLSTWNVFRDPSFRAATPYVRISQTTGFRPMPAYGVRRPKAAYGVSVSFARRNVTDPCLLRARQGLSGLVRLTRRRQDGTISGVVLAGIQPRAGEENRTPRIFHGKEAPATNRAPADTDNKGRIDVYVVLPLDDQGIEAPGRNRTCVNDLEGVVHPGICRRADGGDRTRFGTHTKGYAFQRASARDRDRPWYTPPRQSWRRESNPLRPPYEDGSLPSGTHQHVHRPDGLGGPFLTADPN